MADDLRERAEPLARRPARRRTPATEPPPEPEHGEIFSSVTNVAVTVLASLGTLAVALYILVVDAAADAPQGQPLAPRSALFFTMVFIGLGPFVVLEGQRRIEALAHALGVDDRPSMRLLRHHGRFVAIGTITATAFAWIPTRQLDAFGAFPMPAPGWMLVYWLVSAAAICLCVHGIFTAALFLRTAHFFGRRDALASLTKASCEHAFARAHVYVAWAFSVVGALQLPVLLLFRPAMPTASQVVALVFIVILSLVGPLLFWLPRHWQRACLQEEAAGIVREVAAGGPPELLDKLPAYEFWMQRLKTTGLSLTLPALSVAAVTRAEDLEILVRAYNGLTGS